MALLSDINNKLVTLVEGALTGIDAQVGKGYPADDAALDVKGTTRAIAGIKLRQSTFKNDSMRYTRETDPSPCGIASTLSDTSLAATQVITLTLAIAEGQTAVLVDDAVDCQFINGDFNQAASATAIAGDTLATLATKLATAINTVFVSLVTATASGDVVTITNIGTAGFNLSSNTGNADTVKKAVLCAYRSYQLVIYCGDQDVREAIQEQIEDFLGTAEDGYGFNLDSGEAIRLKLNGSKAGDSDTQKDVYRDDYLFTIKHVVDDVTESYAVLAPVLNLQTF